jgi:hypothetical protein
MVPDSTFLNYITSEKLAFRCDRPNDPMRTYAIFYTMRFPPATKSYVINSRDEPMEFDYAPSNWGDISEGCRNRRVSLRTTALVAIGALQGNVDDMLELAIRCEMFNVSLSYPLMTHDRLWAGVDTDIDVQRGAKLIRRVYEGPFLPEKKGVAASLVCYLFVNCDDPQAESRRGTSGAFRNWVAALHFAAQSCRLGHFSFACNFVAETSLTIGAEFQPTYDQELREELDLVLAHRQTFQEETGYQPRKPQICARCLMMKPEGSLLRCAGSCARIRKPRYCGRECQKAASSFYPLLLVRHLMDFFLLCRIGKNIGNGARKTSILLPQTKRMKRCFTTCT